MQAVAIIKNVGKSPKKTRIPAMIVKGMKVDDALNSLKFMRKGTAIHIYKAIKSAAANAMQKQAKLESLIVTDIRIDKGAHRIKHYHPRAKGGGYYGWERGKANITVVVSDEPMVKTIKKNDLKEEKEPMKKEEAKKEKKTEKLESKKLEKVTKTTKRTPKKVKNAE